MSRTASEVAPYSPKYLEGPFSEGQQRELPVLYLFQNAGESRARAVKSSNLPSSMHTVSTTRPKGSTILKLSVAPTWPSPGL